MNQLVHEGFVFEEISYAADNCKVDWKEQAARSAANYLQLTKFTRQRMIEQLEFDGFTHEQAVYGATKNGL